MLEKLSKNVKITLSILFIFLGVILISFNYFKYIKSNVFNDKAIKFMEQSVALPEEVEELDEREEVIEEPIVGEKEEDRKENYIGYLNVPDVKIKRGFVDPNSKYNSIGYNVTIIKGSTMPNVNNGNFILAAHRGNSSVSFFDKLYKLKLGAKAIVTYKNKDYTYALVDFYEVPKVGEITIRRNGDISTLTLITCTRNNKKTQTVFVFELKTIE